MPNLNKVKRGLSTKWPPQNWSQNKILAKGAIHRAQSGLFFLEECLECIHTGGTDAAYSRSLYMLLSHNVELILEARLFLASTETERPKLIEEAKAQHDLQNLSERLTTLGVLSSLGIKHIKRRWNDDLKEYAITMDDDSTIIVQDLIDVRYDFKYDQLRGIDPNESTRMKTEVEIFLKMARRVMEMIDNP